MPGSASIVAMFRLRAVSVSAIGWFVGAVTSIAIGLVALSMIGSGMSGSPLKPLSPDALTRPADLPGPGATQSSSATARPTSSALNRTVPTSGGTAVVGCAPGGAYLVGWSPAPGFHAEDVLRGPAPVVRVKFERDGREVAVSARCVAGVIRPTVDDEERGDH